MLSRDLVTLQRCPYFRLLVRVISPKMDISLGVWAQVKAEFSVQTEKQVYRLPRGITELTCDIIETACRNKDISYSRLENYSEVPYSCIKGLFSRLVERNLITITQGAQGRKVQVTGKGREWLFRARQVLEAVT
jgi:predicted transcriptional regulator